MCRGSELCLAAGITGFLIKVDKGKWEVNKFLLETLFGPLRWVGAYTSLPSVFRLQPFSLVSDLEERGPEICEGLLSELDFIEKWEKENLE